MRLLVIDGNSIANRAFYGIKLLTTKDGRYTNAIYGFLNILLSLLKECEPDEVAVAFDLKPHLPPQNVRWLQGHPPRHAGGAGAADAGAQGAAGRPWLPHRYRRGLGSGRYPGHAGRCLRRPGTTASLPPETGTACSW